MGGGRAAKSNDASLAGKVRALRNYGSMKKYYNEVIGYNMRLDEIQAAFLSVKLNYINAWTEERRQIASWYDEALSGIGDLILPFTAPGATHVYHLYVIRTRNRSGLQEVL